MGVLMLDVSWARIHRYCQRTVLVCAGDVGISESVPNVLSYKRSRDDASVGWTQPVRSCTGMSRRLTSLTGRDADGNLLVCRLKKTLYGLNPST